MTARDPLLPTAGGAYAVRHRLVSPLLSVYDDGELPDETRAEVEAHLAECAECAAELRAARAVRARLGRLLPERAARRDTDASAALRARILAAIGDAAPPAAAEHPQRPSGVARRDVTRGRAGGGNRYGSGYGRRLSRGVAWGGWLVAAVLALVLVDARFIAHRSSPPSIAMAPGPPRAPLIPMVEGAVADYQAHLAGDLPGGAGSVAAVAARVPFAVAPLTARGAQVVGAWTTAIRGQPVAAIAYRWGDRTIVQYVVPESLFFRHSAVRTAVATQGLYATRDGALGVVASPGVGSGSVLVGDASPDELARLTRS